MRSSNLTLSDNVFQPDAAAASNPAADTMTLQGTINKAAIMLLLVLASAWFVWDKFFNLFAGASISGLEVETLLIAQQTIMPWTIGGAITGVILVVIIALKHTSAPFLAPLYALAEGLFIGGISAIFELQFPGIVMQAVGLTFAVFLAMLGIYKSGLIDVTENFRLGVAASIGGVLILYLVSMIGHWTGLFNIGFIHDSSPLGIAFSVFVVGLAALTLVLDFDFIERGSEKKAPKHMEWYGAFSLIVTLVWLYIEVLRLLSKLQSRD